MYYKLLLAVSIMLLLSLSAFPQEAEVGKDKMSTEPMEMMPPQPLNNAMLNWLVGEWEGTTETNMGKSEDWMKIEKGLDGQFLLMHYKGKNTEVKDEAMKSMKEQMHMTDEQINEMMQKPYMGMGVITLNPKSGELMGYWFDSYRDVSKGTGTVEAAKSMMTWTSPAMGTMSRTTEKLGPDKMKITIKGKDTSGIEFEGTSMMTRKK